MSTQADRQVTNVDRGRGPGPRDDACLICMIAFEPDTDSRTHRGCNRTFCGDCLDRWVQEGYNDGRTVTCPNCRGVISQPPRLNIHQLSLRDMLFVPAPEDPQTPPPSYQFRLDVLPHEVPGESAFQAFDLRTDTWVEYPRRHIPIDVDTHLAAAGPSGRSARNEPLHGREGTPLPIVHIQEITNSSDPYVRHPVNLQPIHNPYAIDVGSIPSQAREPNNNATPDLEFTLLEDPDGDVGYVESLHRRLQQGETIVEVLRANLSRPFGMVQAEALAPEILGTRAEMESIMRNQEVENTRLREAARAVQTIGRIEDLIQNSGLSIEMDVQVSTMLDQHLVPVEQSGIVTTETNTALDQILLFIQGNSTRNPPSEREDLNGSTNTSPTSIPHASGQPRADQSQQLSHSSNPPSSAQPVTTLPSRRNKFYTRLLRLSIEVEQAGEHDSHPLYSVAALRFIRSYITALDDTLKDFFSLRDQSTAAELLNGIEIIFGLLESVIHQSSRMTRSALESFIRAFQLYTGAVDDLRALENRSLHITAPRSFAIRDIPDGLITTTPSDIDTISSPALDATHIYNESSTQRETRLTGLHQAFQAIQITSPQYLEALDHLNHVHAAYRALSDVQQRLHQRQSVYHSHQPVTLTGPNLLRIAADRLERYRDNVRRAEHALCAFCYVVRSNSRIDLARQSEAPEELTYPRWVQDVIDGVREEQQGPDTGPSLQRARPIGSSASVGRGRPRRDLRGWFSRR